MGEVYHTRISPLSRPQNDFSDRPIPRAIFTLLITSERNLGRLCERQGAPPRIIGKAPYMPTVERRYSCWHALNPTWILVLVILASLGTLLGSQRRVVVSSPDGLDLRWTAHRLGVSVERIDRHDWEEEEKGPTTFSNVKLEIRNPKCWGVDPLSSTPDPVER